MDATVAAPGLCDFTVRRRRLVGCEHLNAGCGPSPPVPNVS